jgi:hypothetical protein
MAALGGLEGSVADIAAAMLADDNWLSSFEHAVKEQYARQEPQTALTASCGVLFECLLRRPEPPTPDWDGYRARLLLDDYAAARIDGWVKIPRVAKGNGAMRLSGAEIAALRVQLLDNGWNVVPSSPRDKKCYVVGWPVLECNEFCINNWELAFPAHSNTAAVGNRDCIAIDIDILSDPTLAHQVQILAFEHLGDTPFIRVGLWPKRLLVYRKRRDVIESLNKRYRVTASAISSASYKAENGNGDGVEILSTGRQFVIHGFHSGAGQPYRWVGDANPLEDTPEQAPLVTQERIDAFLAAVRAIMPFAVAKGGGAVTDSERHINADGLIDDGRESFLRDCIYRAGAEISATDGALTVQAVAARGWELFKERAWLDDGEWRFEEALGKARLLLRRLNDGRIGFGDLRRAVPHFPEHAADPAAAERDELRRSFTDYDTEVEAKYERATTKQE